MIPNDLQVRHHKYVHILLAALLYTSQTLNTILCGSWHEEETQEEEEGEEEGKKNINEEENMDENAKK